MSSPGPSPSPGPTRRERRSHRRHVRWVVIGVIVAAIVAGGIVVALVAGGGSDDEQASTSTATTTEAGPGPTSGPDTTATTEGKPTPSTTVGKPGGPCKAADVTAVPASSTVRGASQVAVVVLDNTGGRQCTITGYVGVALLGPGGEQLTATVNHGGEGIPAGVMGEATVTVEPGAQASFVMAWNPITGSCLDVRSFDLTLPGDTKVVRLKSSVNVCGGAINISPVQPGLVSA